MLASNRANTVCGTPQCPWPSQILAVSISLFSDMGRGIALCVCQLTSHVALSLAVHLVVLISAELLQPKPCYVVSAVAGVLGGVMPPALICSTGSTSQWPWNPSQAGMMLMDASQGVPPSTQVGATMLSSDRLQWSACIDMPGDTVRA